MIKNVARKGARKLLSIYLFSIFIHHKSSVNKALFIDHIIHILVLFFIKNKDIAIDLLIRFNIFCS